MKRSLFIGDVHGCFKEFAQIIDDFGFVKGSDTLYQTGDIINKGPSALECIQLTQELGIQCVLGNHEARLLKTLDTPKLKWTEKERERIKRIKNIDYIYSVISKWPLWIDTPEALLVHAGIEPHVEKLEDMNPDILLSIRLWNDQPWYELVKWPKTIVFGHWAKKGFLNLPGFIGLDSGCVYGKSLSAWCPEEERFYSVPAQKVYSEINEYAYSSLS